MTSSAGGAQYPRSKINDLRRAIQDNIRVQLGGASAIKYVDPANFLSDVTSRSNHVLFGRRGTGKTLLLHSIQKELPESFKTIYINCEDYKNHSFPNVLIEILDKLFDELESKLTAWFGKKKRLRDLISSVRKDLLRYKETPDTLEQRVKESSEQNAQLGGGITAPHVAITASASDKQMFERVKSQICCKFGSA